MLYWGNIKKQGTFYSVPMKQSCLIGSEIWSNGGLCFSAVFEISRGFIYYAEGGVLPAVGISVSVQLITVEAPSPFTDHSATIFLPL